MKWYDMYIRDGKYKMIYLPDHHKADSAGMVYEHQLVAEQILGRQLEDGEEVHHKNHNKLDNDPQNLIVFKTKRDHTTYHAYEDESNLIKLTDGSFIVNRDKIDIQVLDNNKNKIYIKRYNVCPLCGGLKSETSTICINCYNKYRARNVPSREELEKGVYNFSMVKLSKLYSVCDKNIAKWCDKYGIDHSYNGIKELRSRNDIPKAVVPIEFI